MARREDPGSRFRSAGMESVASTDCFPHLRILRQSDSLLAGNFGCRGKLDLPPEFFLIFWAAARSTTDFTHGISTMLSDPFSGHFY
jgi:hypothetical protein